MNPILTADLLEAIRSNQATPVRVLDPESNETYVIVRADVYEQLVRTSHEEYRLADTYLAQEQSLMRAGWDDQTMDDYNNYDENFKKLSQ